MSASRQFQTSNARYALVEYRLALLARTTTTALHIKKEGGILRCLLPFLLQSNPTYAKWKSLIFRLALDTPVNVSVDPSA